MFFLHDFCTDYFFVTINQFNYMDLLGITALYIFLYVPILWICTYPVYWLNKKTKSKVNPFLMSLELQFLGSSLSSLVRVLLGGIYLIFFGLLYSIVFFYTLIVTGNFIFSWFNIWNGHHFCTDYFFCLFKLLNIYWNLKNYY